MTLKQISYVLGVTEGRVCQIMKWRIEPAIKKQAILNESMSEYRDFNDKSKLIVNWITF